MLEARGLPIALDPGVDVDEVVAATGRDKKVLNGRLDFVLASGIGDTSIVADVSSKELGASLQRLGLKK